MKNGSVTNNRLPLVVCGCVAVLTLARLLMTGHVELLPEEAYYWTYSKHPALGYFDHPPMVAWIIAAGTAVLGDTELGVRLGTIVLSLGSCLLLFLTGRTWFGERTALAAVLSFTLLPIFVGTGFIVTPDGPLLFFWLLTLYAISKALASAKPWYWLLAGIGLGCALLSKYYALLLTVSLLVFLIFSPTHRRWLRRPQPWLALVVALLVFSPVIIWNAQHNWASFLFQSTRASGPQRNTGWDVLMFWVYQLAAVTPLPFVLFAYAAIRGVKRGWIERKDAWNFAVSFSLPLFLLFVLVSFRTQIRVNWTAPAFLSLLPAAMAVFFETTSDPHSPRAQRWRAGGWVSVLICVVVIVFGHISIGWGVPKAFAYSHAGGWRQLGKEVDAARATLAGQTNLQPFVLGVDKYNIASEVGFYTGRPDECVNLYALGAHGLGFRYWVDLKKFDGRPAVAVLSKLRDDLLEDLGSHFDKVDEPTRVDIQGHGRRVRTVYFMNCHGYHAEPRD